MAATKSFEERKAESEARSNAAFERVQTDMKTWARQYIQKEIDIDTLCERMNGRGITKAAMWVYIIRDLKSRRMP